MTRRPSVLVAVLALFGALLAGCGESQDPYAAFIDGVDAVEEAGSSRLSLTSETTVGGQDLTVTGEGVQAFDGSAAELTVSTALPGTEETFEITTRVIDETIYLTGGFFEQLVGAGTWIEVTPEDIESQTGIDLSSLVQSQEQATASLDQLRGITEESFTEVGEEDVNGVSATHYRGTVDTAEALEALPAEQRDALQSMLEMLPDTYEVDVWVDEQSRPVRIRTDLEVEVQGESVPSTTTIEFTDYGVEIDVAAPEDTVPFDEFLERAGGLGGGGGQG